MSANPFAKGGKGAPKAKTQMKKVSKPTAVFKKSAKKPEADDMPGKMGGGKTAPMQGRKGMLAKKLKGVAI